MGNCDCARPLHGQRSPRDGTWASVCIGALRSGTPTVVMPRAAPIPICEKGHIFRNSRHPQTCGLPQSLHPRSPREVGMHARCAHALWNSPAAREGRQMRAELSCVPLCLQGPKRGLSFVHPVCLSLWGWALSPTYLTAPPQGTATTGKQLCPQQSTGAGPQTRAQQ